MQQASGPLTQQFDLKMAPRKKEEKLLQSEDHVSVKMSATEESLEDETSGLNKERKDFNEKRKHVKEERKCHNEEKIMKEEGEPEVNRPTELEMLNVVADVEPVRQVNLETIPSKEEDQLIENEQVTVRIGTAEKSVRNERKSIDDSATSIIELFKAERTPSVSSNDATSSITPLPKRCSCCRCLGVGKLSLCCVRTLNDCFFWATYLFIICLLIFIVFRLGL